MSLCALGPAWVRRLSRITELNIVHGSSAGYMFNFTTNTHVHGQFNLWAWRKYRKQNDVLWPIPCNAVILVPKHEITYNYKNGVTATYKNEWVETYPVWWTEPIGFCPNFTSCRILFPKG